MWKLPDFFGVRIQKNLPALGTRVFLVLVFLCMGNFSLMAQSHFGKTFQHQHDEQCGALVIEKMQEKALGVYGSREYFESWMEDKIVEGERGAFNLRTQEDDSPRQIPVVVHIIHNGTPVGQGANIPEEQILSQIRILNEDYNRLNEDTVLTPVEFRGVAASANIEFVLARRDPEGLPTTGINRVMGSRTSYREGDIALISSIAFWPPEEYLNIWVLPMPRTILGFSSFPVADLPGLTEFPPTSRNIDGVGVNHIYFGTGGSADVEFRGRTATHEIGHFLGLRHIWGDGGCGDSDYVDDTPDQNGFNIDCQFTPRVTCGSRDMIENYMDYTQDQCMNLFTQGQVDRMNVVLASSPRRNSLLSSPGLVPPELFEIDLSIEKVISPSDFVCSPEVLPGVLVMNAGSETITSANVEISLNGTVIEQREFNLNLATAEIDTLYFNPLMLPIQGANTFEVEVLEVNNQPDQDPFNSYKRTNPSLAANIDLPYRLDLIRDFHLWDILNPDQGITWSSISLNIEGVSQELMYVNSYKYRERGEINYFISPRMDLSEIENAQLTFNMAYAPFDSEDFQDKLLVAVSTDCGNTFNLTGALYDKQDVTLATQPRTFSEFFPNAEDQFRREVVDLSAYAGQPNVRIAFIVVNGFGNNLFVKDIEILEEELFRYDFELVDLEEPLPVTAGLHSEEVLLVRNTGNLPINGFFVDRLYNRRDRETLVFEDFHIPIGESRTVGLPTMIEEGGNRLDYRIHQPSFDQNPGREDELRRHFVQRETEIRVPWRQDFNQVNGVGAWIRINPERNFPTWRTRVQDTEQDNVLALVNFVRGDSHWLASPLFDLSATGRASLFFDWAAGGFTGEDQVRLELIVSSNGGRSGTVIWSREGNEINTISGSGLPNPNTRADYESAFVNLSEFTGEGTEHSRVFFKVTDHGASNAALYLDNLELFLSDNPDPVDPGLDNTVIFPNPADDVFNISFNLSEHENVRIEFINMSGQVAYMVDFENTLNQTYSFSRALLSSGVFVVKITGQSISATKRLIIR